MKVFIIGANGGIGKILSKQLSEEDDFTPLAMIRDKSQREYFEDIGVETVLGDLEDSVDELTGLLASSDAIVFTAGSGGNTGLDKTLEIDLDGAVKSMEAADKADISRYIMVSAKSAGDRDSWKSNPIKPYLIAKHYADRFLLNSGLKYTILRPGSLTDDDGKGSINTDPSTANTREIPREDVATTITECLKNESSFEKVLEFVSGEDKITEVIQSL